MPLWVISVDTRERQPLPFPRHLVLPNPRFPPWVRSKKTDRVEVIREALPTGDYLLKGFEAATLIERKGRLREVVKNVLDERDRRRFVSCLKRLRSECQFPVLLLEGTPLSLLGRREDPDYRLGLSELIRLLRVHQVELLLLPGNSASQRAATGEYAARLLIAGANSYAEGRTPRHCEHPGSPHDGDGHQSPGDDPVRGEH